MTLSADTSTGRRLLAEHVADFNDGVRAGDFSAMLSRLAEDAEMTFEGIPVGPFRGRAEVRDAYAAQPPDDTLSILGVRESADEVVADYAWDRRPGVRAGELRLRHDGRVIRSLVVSFVSLPEEGD